MNEAVRNVLQVVKTMLEVSPWQASKDGTQERPLKWQRQQGTVSFP